jgi:hypothetical protein
MTAGRMTGAQGEAAPEAAPLPSQITSVWVAIDD